MKDLSTLLLLVSCTGPVQAAAPVIDSVIHVSYHQADVYFSEAVSLVSSQTAGNYSANQGMGYALSAVRDSLDPSLVHIAFSQAFVNGRYYTLTVTGVQDLSGNTTINDTETFLFFVPGAGDVVINEIMADPDPPQGLPDREYIELFNRTDFPLRLKGWTLTCGSSVKTFPYTVLPPDGFLILCHDSAVSAFLPYGRALGLFTSTSALANTGSTVVLRSNTGNTIHAIYYNDTWYRSPIKNSGGWSLEQIDPDSPCGGKANWRASAAAPGGTPGKTNSVIASSPDRDPPAIAYAAIISPAAIRIVFNEFTDSASLSSTANYFIDHGIGNPLSAAGAGPDFSGVTLSLPSSLQSGIIYSVAVENVKDCSGNRIAPASVIRLAIPEQPGAGDIVINEILFQPKENGTEWIEIYNRSEKAIDLKGIYLCNSDAAGNFSSIEQVAPAGRLMMPGGHIVLSKDRQMIQAQYSTVNPEGFADLPTFITMRDDSGWVALTDASQKSIDKVHYHSEWHLPLISDTKGISLERINYDGPAQDPGNWHSAAESAGGATPAYRNSQYMDGGTGTDISIFPEVFSPDNDGHMDVLAIHYAFDLPGMIGNIKVYDEQGRLARNLVRNELLAVSGTFFWNGLTEERMKAPIGIYIISFEAFNREGKTRKYKKACVVAGKLR